MVLLTVATPGSDEVQEARFVRLCVVPSPNVPIAVQNSEVPCAICGLVQLTAIESNGDEVTVSVADGELTAARVAVMFDVPLATPVARPLGVRVAALVTDDAQVAIVVRFCVVELLNVPVAVYCTVLPGEIVMLAGLTAIDCRVAFVTVRAPLPEAEGPPGLVKLALIEADPCACAVAVPELPAALLTVAADVLLDCQFETPLMFCVLVSLNVPVAMNRCVVPGARLALPGETEIDAMVALLTFSVDESLNVPKETPIMELPTPLLTASPFAGPMVAVEVVEEVQFTPLAKVTFNVLPSLNVAMAAY